MLSVIGAARSSPKGSTTQALYTLSSRWKTSSSADDYQFLQRSKTSTMHFQKSLLRLPIPPLAKTCERYMQAVEPLLSPAEYQGTKLAVQKFMTTDGPELDKHLRFVDMQNKDTSYISAPWFDMYLRDRVPLPINYNPIIAYVDEERPGYNNQLVRATNLLISSLRFSRSLRANCLSPEVFFLNPKTEGSSTFELATRLAPQFVSSYVAYAMKAFPLDMSQFEGLFNGTRIPKKTKDAISRAPDAKHMLVMRNGHFYVFDVFDKDGNILPPEDIYACMKQITEDNTPPAEYPLGVLTTTNRDVWAANRNHLEEIGNAEALSLIDSGFICLCLDSNPLETMEDTVRSFLHSDGVNRWFDKSVSLLFDQKGRACINFEHSWGDGVAVLRYFKDIYTDTQNNPFVSPETAPSKQPAAQVRRLEFKLDDKAKAAIKTAMEDHQKVTSNLGVTAFKYDGLGKNLCKEAKVSPDGIIQLGFQAFCESVLRPNEKSADELRLLLKTASEKHQQLIKEAATGHGMDRHLFALRKTAEALENPTPEIFADRAYALINHNIISTSTLNAPMVLVGGFGPVVPDGYGLGYSMRDEWLGSIFTNYIDKTSSSDFEQSLGEAYQIIDKVLRKTFTK